MKGKYRIVIQNKRIRYEFAVRRNLTIIRGDSATGKTALVDMVREYSEDGAAFGPEMEKIMRLLAVRENIMLYLPESFEWLILKSGVLQDKEIKEVLENTCEYVESGEYFSWERYFTALLVKKTGGTYLQYSKKTLNPVYAHKSEKEKILAAMEAAGEMFAVKEMENKKPEQKKT